MATAPPPAPGLSVLPHFCIVGVQLLFGSTAVVGRLGLRATNPINFTIWRFFLAAPMLLLILILRTGAVRLPRKDLLSGVLLGGAGLVGANLSIVIGIALSGQVTTSTWQPMQLIFTTLLSFGIGLEARPGRRKLLGLVLGLLGAFLIVALDPSVRARLAEMVGAATPEGSTSSDRLEGQPRSPWGHVALFINTLSSSMLFVLRRWLVGGAGMKGKGLAPTEFVVWTHVVAAPLTLILGTLADRSSGVRGVICRDCDSLLGAPPSADVWAALAFYTIVPTIVCQSGSAWASQHLEPSTLAMYSVLQPAASTCLSMALRAIVPSLRGSLLAPSANVLGALPVVLGLWLVTSEKAERVAGNGAEEGKKVL